MTYFFQQDCTTYLSPSCTSNWGPRVQMPKNKEDISHSNHQPVWLNYGSNDMPPKILKHRSHIFKGQIHLIIVSTSQVIDCPNSCCCQYFDQYIQIYVCLIAPLYERRLTDITDGVNLCHSKCCPWTSPCHHLTGH